MLARILRANPQIAGGVVFDLPEVVQLAKATWSTQHADLLSSRRVEFVPGSFLAPGDLPAAADGDVFFLRHIVHDWPDKETATILRNLRTAIGSAKATVVLIETAPRKTKARKSELTFQPLIDSEAARRETFSLSCWPANTLIKVLTL